jgi:plastocyanin
MRRTIFVLAVVLAAAGLALAGCGGDDDEAAGTDTETTTTETGTTTTGEAGSNLIGTVGPGFTIELQTSDGASVETLAAGDYTIEVDDQSDMHNFHLTGPGVEETTTVAEVGTQTWNVTFEAGTYNFVCDPHAGQMNGSFTVSG